MWLSTGKITINMDKVTFFSVEGTEITFYFEDEKTVTIGYATPEHTEQVKETIDDILKARTK